MEPGSPALQGDSTIGATREEPPHASKVMSLLFNMLSRLFRASLVAQRLKHLPARRETRVQSLGWEDSLEKTTHSRILAWRIPWTTVHGAAKSWARLSDFHFTSE